MNNEKKAFDYTAEAVSTLSNKFHGELVSESLFLDSVQDAVRALKRLDQIKKALFYGSPLPEVLQRKVFKDASDLPGFFKNREFGEQIIHGAIGAATESGEMLEALERVLIFGQEFDTTNIAEETGDSLWYHAVIGNACGFTLEDAQCKNIAKLRKRYPNKFTEFDAINRDLVEERKILEKPVDEAKDEA